MKRLDHGHLHLKLEVPAGNRTRASTVGGKHSRKEPLEQPINSYSEHLHMSPRHTLQCSLEDLHSHEVGSPIDVGMPQCPRDDRI
jgi:hypothetical protein